MSIALRIALLVLGFIVIFALREAGLWFPGLGLMLALVLIAVSMILARRSKGRH